MSRRRRRSNLIRRVIEGEEAEEAWRSAQPLLWRRWLGRQGERVGGLRDKLFRNPPPDPLGDTVFDNLPSWLNQDLTLVIWGRDTYAPATSGESFRQYVFLNGERFTVNVFAADALGRWTETKTYTFHIRLVRSGTQ